MGVLKHLPVLVIFWCGGMKHFEPRIYKNFELYQVIMYNFLY